MLGLKLNHVSKMRHGSIRRQLALLLFHTDDLLTRPHDIGILLFHTDGLGSHT